MKEQIIQTRFGSVALRSVVVAVIAFSAILSCLGNDLQAQSETTSQTVKALETRVVDFFEELTNNGAVTKDVYKTLLTPQSPLFQQGVPLDALIARTDAIPQQYGEYREYERLDSKQYGKDLVFLRYLYKCEDYPLIWTFWFYRTPSDTLTPTEWRVISLRFDNDLRLLELSR